MAMLLGSIVQLEESCVKILDAIALPGRLHIRPDLASAYVEVQYVPDLKAAEGYMVEGLRERGLILETRIAFEEIEDTEGKNSEVMYRLVIEWLEAVCVEGGTEKMTARAFAEVFRTRSQRP